MRTVALAMLSTVALLAGVCPAVRADDGAWRYAPAAPPQPPPGDPTPPYPVPLGGVGQISFWSSNHGLLITGGTEPAGAVKAGLYSYDGVEWRQLSTVCGGAQGRIAWAGPDEFWTIADQRAGQIQGRQEGSLASISLCHFLDGKVVGSYAMPLGLPDSYLTMDAAACLSASDCWFAGEDGQSPNAGAFHLHWDGSNISASYDGEDHAVTGLANFEGELYEGLAVGPEDSYLPGEDRAHPPVIRTVAPAASSYLCEGEITASPFCNVFTFAAGGPIPTYPRETSPDVLGGFDMATDGSPLGEGATQLWAAADPVGASEGRATAPVTILRDANEGTWTQVIPRPDESTPLGPGGYYLGGSEIDAGTSQATSGGNGIAPEPGTTDAWLSLRRRGGELAEVARLEANGTLGEPQVLPNSTLDPVGGRGEAGPIACAGPADCWMATSLGWLFHLGGQHTRDEDPYFGQLITERPPDASVPVIYPDLPPVEEQLSQQPVEAEPTKAAKQPTPAKRGKARALVLKVKSRFLHGRILQVSFTLTGRAHVQLIARLKGKIVAHTRLESLSSGRHRLSLTLQPGHWPTKLQFEAKPLKAPAPASSTAPEGTGPSAPNPNNTVST